MEINYKAEFRKDADQSLILNIVSIIGRVICIIGVLYFGLIKTSHPLLTGLGILVIIVCFPSFRNYTIKDIKDGYKRSRYDDD